MSFTLAISSASSPSFPQPNKPSSISPLSFSSAKPHHPNPLPSLSFRVLASSTSTPNAVPSSYHPFTQKLQSFAKSAILLCAASLMIGKLSQFPARAESPVVVAEQSPTTAEDEGKVEVENTQKQEQSSPLSEFLESNSEAVDALKALLQQKLENGEDEEAMRILSRLDSAQPEEIQWKFLMARLMSELGQTENARKVFEEILERNPLSFEALFENALLMDRCGEGEAVIRRLEEALTLAEEENKAKEARDVRLIMAQIQFLQKKVDEALQSYQELAQEDPRDFRPYFCQGMIYSLLDRNSEAKEQFAKYRELSPKRFEVEGYLRTPLSRMKLFGSNDN